MVDIFDVSTHAVLPAQIPRCREVAHYAMREVGGELVSQIVERIIAFEHLHIVESLLVNIGITHRERLQQASRTKDLRERHIGEGFYAHIVEAEIG